MDEENIPEIKFRQWLDKNGIPYWYIQQDIETFSKELKKQFIKRPDFFLLIPNFGFIFIEVKGKKSAEKYDKFFISVDEVEKYINLQRILNAQVWYAISSEVYHYNTWFWIPITKIAKAGFIFKTKKKGDQCYSIPTSEFIQVSEDDSLERLFAKFLKLN